MRSKNRNEHSCDLLRQFERMENNQATTLRFTWKLPMREKLMEKEERVFTMRS